MTWKHMACGTCGAGPWNVRTDCGSVLCPKCGYDLMGQSKNARPVTITYRAVGNDQLHVQVQEMEARMTDNTQTTITGTAVRRRKTKKVSPARPRATLAQLQDRDKDIRGLHAALNEQGRMHSKYAEELRLKIAEQQKMIDGHIKELESVKQQLAGITNHRDHLQRAAMQYTDTIDALKVLVKHGVRVA